MNRAERLESDGAVDPVLFFGARNPNGIFSNFYPTAIVLPNPWTFQPVWYRTREHRYQAMKATTKAEHDYVAKSATAYQSKQRGREVTLRDGWGSTQDGICWFVMCECLVASVYQDTPTLDALTGTGLRHMYEDSPTDDIWGWRFEQSYTGKNLLGKAWMHTRWMIEP